MKALVASIGLLTPALAGAPGHSAQSHASGAQQFPATHSQLGSNDFGELDRRRPVTRSLSASTMSTSPLQNAALGRSMVTSRPAVLERFPNLFSTSSSIRLDRQKTSRTSSTGRRKRWVLR